MNNRKLLGNAGLLGVATLLSRVLALIRDMAMAWLLGAGPVADCLVAALRLPHAIRRLLGEGALSMTLTAWLAQLHRARLRVVAQRLSWRCALLLGCVLLALLWGTPTLSCLLLPGFLTEQQALAASLLQLALPYIFWAGLAALCMALLHSLGIFGPSALSPIVFNLTVLSFTLAAALLPLPQAHTLALGMACGGFVQWFVQWCGVRRLLWGERTASLSPASCAAHAPVRLRQLPAGLVGAAAPQLVLLAAMGLASTAQHGQVTALYYAERILELPLGLVGVCLGMASLPVLSHHVTEGDMRSFAVTLRTALRWALWLGLAACAGLWAVGDLLVPLLFGHGQFAADAIQATCVALAIYAPAIPACAIGRNLLAATTALGFARQGAFSALASLSLTLATGLLGLHPAMAACLGLYVQPLWLWCLVRLEFSRHGLNLFCGHTWLWQGLAAALAAGGAACWARHCCTDTEIFSLLLAVGTGAAAWAMMLLVLQRGLTCAEK